MKSKFKDGQRGFSLVEMLVVVAIMGIMTAIAVPKYEKYMAIATQTEAESGLASIATLQELYYSDEDRYGTMAQIEWKTDDPKRKYNWTENPANPNQTYRIAARSRNKLCSDATYNDVQYVNQTGVITVYRDGTEGC